MDKERKKILKIFKRKKNTKYFKEGCIKDRNTKLILKNRIGTESRFGEAYKACYPLSCKYDISIKKIPITDKELLYKDNPTSLKALNNSFIYGELLMMKLTNLLVEKKINPHLPLVYEYYICDDCDFETKSHKNKKTCFLIVNELAKGDLEQLLNEIKPPVDIMKILYFQIYTALYSINKYFNIYHTDLHWGNVLYHEIPKGGYIKYIINKQEIIIPNTGYLVVLWDFGLSVIPEKVNPQNSRVNKWDDYKRITSMLQEDDLYKNKKYDNLYRKISSIMKLFKNPEDFIIYYGLALQETNGISKNINKSDIIATYNMDKKLLTTDETIKKFLITR